MAERSQIYVRYNDKIIIANYYSWIDCAGMVSRAAHFLDYAKSYLNDYIHNYDLMFVKESGIETLRRYLDVDFDKCDIEISVDLLKEYDKKLKSNPETDFKKFIFTDLVTDYGSLFIDIHNNKGDYKIQYCFLYGNTPMTAENYFSTLRQKDPYQGYEVFNYEYIDENFQLIPANEIDNFIEDPDPLF